MCGAVRSGLVGNLVGMQKRKSNYGKDENKKDACCSFKVEQKEVVI